MKLSLVFNLLTDLLLIAVSSMTHTLELINLLNLTTRKLKTELRKFVMRNRSLSALF